MTQDELQHIEHDNKVLREHLELRNQVREETEKMMDVFLPALQEYINTIADIRKIFGEEVAHILKSSRELKIVTGNSQDIINFISSVHKLNEALTPELVDRLQKILK